ncbi:MAG: hypothetical protein LCH38_11205 [Proteobacteria bacterium]|nr:hypothetical protein [Pseudomonadota bacterium]
MSYKNSKNSIERRARRIATRYGLHLMTCQKPDKRVLAHGGYMLRDGETMKILYGDAEYPFSASLDEVTEWLEELDARRGEVPA